MKKLPRLTMEQYAVTLARAAAQRSEDPYFKVGACLIRHDKTVASLGYNGSAPGIDIDWSNRDHRRAEVIHAEANAMRYIRPGEVLFMASTMMPCRECLLMAAAYGIKTIVYVDELDPQVYDVQGILDHAARLGVTIEKVEER